jgi:hypothetical protein
MMLDRSWVAGMMARDSGGRCEAGGSVAVKDEGVRLGNQSGAGSNDKRARGIERCHGWLERIKALKAKILGVDAARNKAARFGWE